MKWYSGSLEKLTNDWKLSENELWADYQVLGPMMSAYRVLATMDDVFPIMVGAKGCSYHVRFAVVAMGEVDFDLGKRPAITLEFTPTQVVTGNLTVRRSFTDRLMKIVGKKDPKLFVLVPTDELIVSGIELDDIERQIEEYTGITTISIQASNIMGQSPQAGYNPAMTALIKPFLGKYKGERSGINLLGWHWPTRSNEREIGECLRMLDKVGVEVKTVLSGGSKLEDIQKAMTAKGNAVVCPAVCGDYVYDMEKDGIPMLSWRSPYGFSGTTEWLTEITTKLGLDRSKEIEELENEYRYKFEENKVELKGKKIFISGGPGRLIGLLHLLNDYEMDIDTAVLFYPHQNSQRDLKHLLDEHHLKVRNFIVSASLYELEELATTIKFDVWAGGYQELHVCKKHHIPFVPITIYTVPHEGYSGAVNFGDKLRMAMQGFDFTESVFNAKELPECIQLHK